MTGRTISHYQVLEKLGEGMGVVYKARDSHLDRFVAIKVLPPERVADPERKRRFVQEARAASALNHPNIITIHDIDQAEGTDFISMELVTGKTLDRLIPRHGMPLDEALKYAVQIADALSRAHAAGIIHRDLKPGNIMVDEHGLVKVLDFGLAKLTETLPAGEDDATRTMKPTTEEGKIVGTVAYMSPEQAEGKKVDVRSDIFSFGSVLYEMVNGRRAFQRDSKASTIAAILREDPKPPSGIVHGLPGEVERIIKRCLRKEPSQRFQHMDDLKVALEELKQESDSGALEKAGTARTQPRRWRRWTVGVAGFLVVAAAGIWWERFRTGASETSPRVVPLTAYHDPTEGPSFSPEGDRVAFSMCRKDDCAVYIKQIGVEPPQRQVGDARYPAWSPDGHYIAFRRTLPEGKVGYFVIPAIGGRESRLVECDFGSIDGPSPYACWLPDSKNLILSLRGSLEEPWALFLFSLESRELKRMTSPPKDDVGDGAPAVSPDGRTLLFTRQARGAVNLLRLGLANQQTPEGEPQKVDAASLYSFGGAWTADGREIVYCGGPGNGFLWRITATGSGRPQRLEWAGEGASAPAVSRQENRLVFSRFTGRGGLCRLDIPKVEGGRMGPSVQVTATTRSDFFPMYSPDGKKIAFMSNRSGYFEIWVCESDGSNPAMLTSLGAELGTDLINPQWSLDGEWIVFYSFHPSGTAIYRIRAAGGKPQLVVAGAASGENPSWSADGQWIYFDSNRSGSHQIWKIGASGGEAVQVTKVGNASVPRASPDGNFVYFLVMTKTSSDSAHFLTGLGSSSNAVWRIPVQGGKEEKILDSEWALAFAVLEEGIYFVQVPGADGRFFLRLYDLATGKIGAVAEFDKSQVGSLSVSPDRRSFLYSNFESSSDLMLVENFR